MKKIIVTMGFALYFFAILNSFYHVISPMSRMAPRSYSPEDVREDKSFDIDPCPVAMQVILIFIYVASLSFELPYLCFTVLMSRLGWFPQIPYLLQLTISFIISTLIWVSLASFLNRKFWKKTVPI